MQNRHYYLLLFLLISFGSFAQCPLDLDETTVAPTNNLLLHLPFDGSLANLGSGNYTITNSGAQYVPTQCGQGLYFDGNNDFVNVSPSMNLVNDFTVCAWISPSSQGNWMGIFSIREQCTSTYRGYSIVQFNLGDYGIATLNNQVNIHQNCTGFSAGDRYTNTGIVIPNNTETFVALTVQNNSSENRTVTLYVNCGQYSTVQTINYPTAVCFNSALNYTTTIGASSGVTNHTSTFHGTIDQLRVYDVALNQDQLLDVYQSCLPVTMDVTEFPDCFGDSAEITVFNTELDVNYQLFDITNNTAIGPPVPGNCGPLVFGTGIYSTTTQFQITAVNTLSSCSIPLDSIVTLTPSATSYSSSQNVTLCTGDSIAISSGYITSAGIYTDTIALSSFCDSIITLTVSEITPYTLDLGPDQSICPNAILDLVIPSGASSYTWQDASNLNSYQVNQAGSYWVTVTDQCGSYSDTINITSQQGILNLGNDTTICSGSTLILNASILTGSYLWQDNSTNPTFSASNTGIYWVEVTSGGCDYVDSIEIQLLQIPSVNIGNDTTICDGDILTISGTVQNVDDYMWSTGEATSSISATQTGIIWLEVSNQCGSASDSLLLTVESVPFINLGNDTILCEGNTVVLDASIQTGSYLWQDNSTNSSYAVTTPGIYWVEISSSNCNFRDSIIFTGVSNPSVNLGNDTTICDGDVLTVSGTVQGVDDYLWSSNETTTSISVAQSGIIWLEVTNQCGSDIDSMNVTIEPIPYFNLGNDTTLCTGSVLILNPNIPNTITTWQDGTQSGTYLVDQTGIYSATLNTPTCSFEDQIQIDFENAPIAELGSDTLICEGDQFFINVQNANGSILWSTGSQEPIIIVSQEGLYSVLVSNICGQAIDEIEIQITNCSCELYIPNSFTPGDGEFNNFFGPVHECALFNYSFRIFNRWGEVIFESTDPSETWDGTYLSRMVQSGTYTYSLLYDVNDLEGLFITGHVNVLY